MEDTFHHTHLAFYLVGVAAAAAVFHDSAQSVAARYELTRKFWLLYAALFFSAYLYTRPLIRRGLGSAEGGRVNRTTLYIAWLVSAVVVHLPPPAALGIDVRADVGLGLTVFVLSVAVLGAAHAAHAAAVLTGVAAPVLLPRSARAAAASAGTSQVAARGLWPVALLNAAALGVACSTFYAFCGNAGGSDGSGGGGGPAPPAPPAPLLPPPPPPAPDAVRSAVCQGLLAPLPAASYPAFANLVLYVSGGGGGGGGPLAPPGAPPSLISPVFTLWLTGVAMYAAHAVADYAAAVTVGGAESEARAAAAAVAAAAAALPRGGPRRTVSARPASGSTTGLALAVRRAAAARAGTAPGGSPPPPLHAQPGTDSPPAGGSSDDGGGGWSASAARRRRGRPPSRSRSRGTTPTASATTPATTPRVLRVRWAGVRRASFDLLARTLSAGSVLGAGGVAAAAAGAAARAAAAAAAVDAELAAEAAAGAAKRPGGEGDGDAAPPPHSPSRAAEGGGAVPATPPAPPADPPSASSPSFLPMVPWYAGTSADLYRMLFGLTVSLKLFLGRFDLRAQHAAALDSAAAAAAAAPAQAPAYAAGAEADDGGPPSVPAVTAPARPPAHGDGRTFEHLALRADPLPPGGAWLDFIADTGDGGDATYTVARALAAPRLAVSVPSHLAARLRLLGAGGGGGPLPAQVAPAEVVGAGAAPPTAARETHVLPRGAALLIGGDLAYPHPTPDTYARRLVAPFEDALPRPRGAPAGTAVRVPDLPPGGGGAAAAAAARAARVARLACLGPSSSRVPASPFGAAAVPPTALGCSPASTQPPPPLPAGRCADHGGGRGAPASPAPACCGPCASASRLASWAGPSALAIPGNHDWVDGLAVFSAFILDRGWLGGWALPQATSYFALRLPAGWWVFGMDYSLAGDLDAAQFRYFARVAEERMGPSDGAILISHEPQWLTRWYGGGDPPPHVGRLISAHLRGRARVHLAGDIHFYMRHSYVAPPAPEGGRGGGAGEKGGQQPAPLPAFICPTPAPATAPEHLVVCGTGGAFTHPTHVFTDATFGPDAPDDDAVPPELAGVETGGPAAARSASVEPGTAPSTRASTPGLADASPPPPPPPVPPPRGEYVCAAAFPPPSTSRALGAANLHLFRLNNTRFDVIGGAIYFALTVSVLPRCAGTAAVLEAKTLGGAVSAFCAAALDAAGAIFAESRLSACVLAAFVLLCLAFARAGGVGALPGPAPPPRPGTRRSLAQAASLRVRTGGLPTQVAWACAHAAVHLAAAVVLAVALDVGVALVARTAGLGTGATSLYSWYRAFEEATFPDPAGLRAALSAATGGAYPGLLKAAMAVYDVPEAIAVGRAGVCGGKAASLTRLQALSFHGGLLAYYWLLATPVVGLLFGAYLWFSCNCVGVHHDEAFSALRLPGHKGFLRLRITPAGDLVLYAVGVASVPRRWTEDPRWRRPGGGGDASRPAHEAAHPSRWAPAAGGGSGRGLTAGPADLGAEPAWEAVDVVVVPRLGPAAAAVLPAQAAGGPARVPSPAKAAPAAGGVRAAVAAGPF